MDFLKISFNTRWDQRVYFLIFDGGRTQQESQILIKSASSTWIGTSSQRSNFSSFKGTSPQFGPQLRPIQSGNSELYASFERICSQTGGRIFTLYTTKGVSEIAKIIVKDASGPFCVIEASLPDEQCVKLHNTFLFIQLFFFY